MMRPIGGFENLQSGIGSAISGAAGSEYQQRMNMASAANRARTRIAAAKEGAEAARYSGEQAGQSAMFGGLMSGISGLAGGVIGGLGKMNANGGSSGGGSGSGSGTAWGMPDATGGSSWSSGDWTQYATDPNQYFNPGNWRPTQTDWGANRTGW